MDDLSDLPDEVRDAIAPHVEADPETLSKIGVAIAAKRDEAKAARVASGIETTWRECEEAYVGIDDANRTEFQSAKWSKPMSMDGPVTTGKAPRQSEYKSTAFIRLTARYVDAGAAKLAEILLPADDKAFSFSETPVPELIKAKDDKSQVVHDGLGNAPLMRAPKPGEPPPMPSGAAVPPAVGPMPVAAPLSIPTPAGPTAAPQAQVPLTVKDLAEEHIEIARKKAKAAEKRIYDWMVECQYTSEVRKVIFDASRLGVGALKAPIPKSSRSIAVKKSGGGMQIEIEDKICPSVSWVDPWNMYPDPSCGENIHDGDFIFERDYLSERQLGDLKKLDGYIASQIDKVIQEGPDKIRADNESGTAQGKDAAKRKDRYEVFYFYGALSREDMDCICAAGGKQSATDSGSKDDPDKRVFAIVTLVNDSVIRATINPLDSGAFPYHSVPWQRRAGHWAGIGVAEQVTTPQKMINAANRAMLNNAGKSAGSQIVVDQSAIRPADGNWIMTPDKVWHKTADAPGDDVRKAFMAVEIPNMTDHLMKIIEFALQLAEESTSIPLITQGQSGQTTPDTFGAAQLQNNNANQLLRSIGYAFDDHITEPVVRQFYEWLLLDPDIPDEEKGDFKINAHGSIALVERAIQDQTIAQMGVLATQPVYGIDPKKWAMQFLKSKRLDPQDFQYTEEQQTKIDAMPPPPAPQVQVAQIRAGVDREKLVAGQQADQRSIQSEEAIAASAHALEGARVHTEQQRTLTDATTKLHELQVKREIAMLEHANLRGMSLDAVKSELAKTAMTINAQKELNAADNAIELHKEEGRRRKDARGAHPQRSTKALAKPAAQAPGRAGNGRQFEQGPPQ